MYSESPQTEPDWPRARHVTVGLVDDIADIRMLLRMAFDRDGRFEVVGEGANGVEAIELVARTHPDLLVLDRRMPVLGGVEALAQIRDTSPRTEVVLYTTGVDRNTAQAAVAAGALQVMEKIAPGPDLIEMVAQLLADHWAAPEADVLIEVGPVPVTAARVWLANTTRLLAAIRSHPEALEPPPSPAALDLMESLVATWRLLADEPGDFRWVARARPEEVRVLVEEWATIDGMSEEQLERLGVGWSPAEGEPFFRALTAGVLDAMVAHEETRQLGRVLADRWRTPA
ncbi:MAG: hypothetical protein NVSMB12_14350 [Acidimicrobiales bacterium]